MQREEEAAADVEDDSEEDSEDEGDDGSDVDDGEDGDDGSEDEEDEEDDDEEVSFPFSFFLRKCLSLVGHATCPILGNVRRTRPNSFGPKQNRLSIFLFSQSLLK